MIAMCFRLKQDLIKNGLKMITKKLPARGLRLGHKGLYDLLDEFQQLLSQEMAGHTPSTEEGVW